MVGLEVIYLLVEGVHPEGLTNEDDSVQFILEPWSVPGDPLHQPLPYPVPQLL